MVAGITVPCNIWVACRTMVVDMLVLCRVAMACIIMVLAVKCMVAVA